MHTRDTREKIVDTFENYVEGLTLGKTECELTDTHSPGHSPHSHLVHLFSFKKLCSYFMCMSILFAWAHCVCSSCRGQKWESDALELESEKRWATMWCWEVTLSSLQEEQSSLSSPISSYLRSPQTHILSILPIPSLSPLTSPSLKHQLLPCSHFIVSVPVQRCRHSRVRLCDKFYQKSYTFVALMNSEWSIITLR